MGITATLKQTPFGFKSTRELFDSYITPKYSALEKSNSLCEYYDFILSAGAILDWLKKEFNQDNRIYNHYNMLNIFISIYNNAKHYTLDNRREYKMYIVQDSLSLLDTNDKGDAICDDDNIWDDTAIWVEHIEGEKGNLNYVCKVQNNNSDMYKYYYLYYICKSTYTTLKIILNRLEE